MKKMDYLFVYGTLRSGERASLAHPANVARCSLVGDDEINGELYQIGGFPGLKMLHKHGMYSPDKAIVKGEVFQILDESLVRSLDAYEGYPTLFTRQQVLTARGRTVWVYIFNHPVKQENLIRSGDWTNKSDTMSAGKGVQAC